METINEWISETTHYLKSLNNDLLINASQATKDLYFGFYIVDGDKIVESPKVMFIGINPGRGNKTINDKKIVNIITGDPFSYLDRYDKDPYPYALAQNTIDLFVKTGLSHVEIKELFDAHAIKLNLFSIITENEANIKRCLNLMNPKRYNEFYKKSCYITIELIKVLKPKVIILEGRSVWNTLIEDCYGEMNCWDKKYNIGLLYSNETNSLFIGYSRRWSNIQSDTDELARILSKELMKD